MAIQGNFTGEVKIRNLNGFLYATDGLVTAEDIPVSGFVPYVGATQAVNLGAFDLTVNGLTVGKGNGAVYSNTAVGYYALKFNTTGNTNTAIGYTALISNTTGYANTAVGYAALQGGTGSFNSALGVGALGSNTNGSDNTSVGGRSMSYNTTGSFNSAFGYSALESNINGLYNTAIGYSSLYAHTNGNSNTSIGNASLGAITNGNNNVAIGYSAGYNLNTVGYNTTANNSIYIGYNTKPQINGNTNEIIIGYNSIGNGSNTVTIGNYLITNNYFFGNIRAGAFIKLGGISSEFLKADGSVDSNSYISSSVTLTINGVSYDLSSNRTWNVGTITSLTGEATASGSGAVSVTLDNSAVINKVLTGLNLTGGGTIVATDSILQAFGKVQNQISGILSDVNYQGVWDANTNTPTLTSSVGTKGHYYIVNVAGSTNLNGITDWKVGDWAIFNGSTWDKVDNTDAVSSVNGYTGAVSLTTNDIPESGLTNLYFTNARARNAISLTTTGTSGASTYDPLTGTFNIPNYTPDLSGYVPYSGATADLNMGVYDLISNIIKLNGDGLATSGVLKLRQGSAAAISEDGYSSISTLNNNSFIFSLSSTVPNFKSFSLNANGLTDNTARTYTLPDASGTLALTNDLNNYVPTSRTLTINGTTYDLTADRTWTISTSASPLTTKGDLYTYSTVDDRLPVGANGQILAADSTTSTGLKWIPNAAVSIINTTASGTDTYTATVAGISSYIDGESILVRFTNGNTTTCTLNINGLGDKLLYRNNDGILIGGDIQNGGEMLCIYNSSLNGGVGGFQCIGTSPNSLIAYVTNDDSVTLTKGMAVYAFGGTGDRMTVKRASNLGDSTSAQTVGLVFSASIAPNQKGIIMMQGLLDGLSILPTSTWADGDTVYLGATAGTITNVKPSAPNHLVYLGVVTTASNGSSGRLYVRIQNGYELQELHNVSLTNPPNNNDGLFYETSTSLWKNKSIATVLGYTPISLSSLSATSPLSYNNTTGVFSIQEANALIGGYISSTDWNTFNNKQNAITLTTTGTSGAATLVGSTLNIPQYQAVLTNPVTGTGAIGRVVFWNGVNTVSSNANFYFDNTNTRLGIGVSSSPTAKLSINGEGQTSSTTSLLIKNSTLSDIFKITDNGAATLSGNITAASFIKSGGTSSQFLKANGSVDSTSYQPLLTNPITGTGTTNTVALFTGTSIIGNSVITQSGSTVGINAPTINTNASLDIQANSAAVVLSMRNRSAAGYAGVHFFNSDNTLVGHFGWGNATAFNLQNNLYFGSLINAPLVLTTNDVERMRILGSNGNVGIGLTTPAAKLDVLQEIRASYANGNQYRTIISNTDGNGRLFVDGDETALLFGTSPSGTGATATEKMRITSAGNVGIGTTSPSGKFHVVGGSTTTSIANAATTLTSRFDLANPAISLGIGYVAQDIPMLQSFNNGTNSATNLTINPFGGNVLIGTTTDNNAKFQVNGLSYANVMVVGTPSVVGSGTNTTPSATFNNSYNWLAITDSNYIQRCNDTNGTVLTFLRGASTVGSIYVDATSTYYYSSSDYRLKEDLKDYNGLDLISKIKTYDYQWKLDKTRMYGVIAHELAEVLPYSVINQKDGTKEDGTIIPQAVDYSKIVAINTKAIQELYNIIKNQQIEIETLKNK